MFADTCLDSQFANQLRRYDQQVRKAGWEELCIDNQNGMVINADASLHYDDHRRMLDDVEAVRQYMTSAYETLVASPGVRVPVSLFETLIGFQDVNQFVAKTTMNVSNRESQQTNYAQTWVPQPIHHSDFHIPWRQQGFSYKQTDGVNASTEAVILQRDQALILGDTDISVNVNGTNAVLTGLTNSAGTLLQAGSMTDWALSSSVALVYPEYNALIGAMFGTDRAAQIPNSIEVFTANDVWSALGLRPAVGNAELTNLQRIRDHAATKNVQPNQFLVAGSVLLVEVTPRAIRIPTSADVTIAPWQKRDRFEDGKFTLFAANTLQVRQDRNGRSGVSFATKA